ncbi:ABC transporter permease [Amphibacillus jilinensis]|uniref:ABC transporter permease n=1 Tax=Amphibacillus jilinensis TaxID=1216008 RepID=UPI0003195E16|nr:ABC transporter permease subunit [Amphibacillus jilinensis]
MSVFVTLLKKECLESWRQFSWFWVPIVFILLAIMDPLTTYYMPTLLDAVGGLPEGTIFEMPDVTAADAMMMSLSQMSMFGVLIIILLTMGTISGERKSGVAELILVKPVNHSLYITAKWLAKLILFLSSFIIAMLSSWYYINLLFDTITFTDWFYMVVFYSLWIGFVVSLTIFYNSFSNKPGLVAAKTVGTLVMMALVNSILFHRLPWFPNNLSTHIGQMLNEGRLSQELWATAIILALLNGLLLFCSFATFRKSTH